jgi:uncharacterized damage-inducible protein DinB
MTAAPGWTEPPTDERELMLWFLNYERDKVLRSVEGLDDEQARWRPDGRLLPILGIVNHLTEVEWRWIDGRYLREPVSDNGSRIGQPPPGDEEFDVDKARPVGEVIEAYRRRARRTDEIVRGAPDLDAACPGSDKQPPRPGLYLRWVLLHLVEETAHHAGHADSTREMLDGTTF